MAKNAGGGHKIEVLLEDADFKILERLRGDLTTNVFLMVLLRMLDSGAVSAPPPCQEESAEDAPPKKPRERNSRRKND
jgi:hypothetical protein